MGIWGKASFEFNATPKELAWVMAALGVASLIGSAGAGLAVDRLGPRKVLILGELAFIPAVLALTLATTIPGFAVLVFFTGLLSAPVYTAVSSMAPFLTSDPARLSIINSRIETGSWAAFIVGPALGALLAETGVVGLDLRARCGYLTGRGPSRHPHQAATAGGSVRAFGVLRRARLGHPLFGVPTFTPIHAGGGHQRVAGLRRLQ